MTRAEWLALAERVEREAPSDGLRRAVAAALGWRNIIPYGSEPDGFWIAPAATYGAPWSALPLWLTSLDAAASAMPSGWRLYEVTQDNKGRWHVLLTTLDLQHDACGFAESEPRARLAAALRARAEMVG